jgi:hypothetical protein
MERPDRAMGQVLLDPDLRPKRWVGLWLSFGKRRFAAADGAHIIG